MIFRPRRHSVQSLRQLVVACAVLASVDSAALGQGRLEDYQRAEQLEAQWRDLVSRDEVRPHFLADHRHCWYRLRVAREKYEHVLVDMVSGERQVALDPVELAQALSQSLGRPVDPQGLEPEIYRVEDGGLVFRYDQKFWEWRIGAPDESGAVADKLHEISGEGLEAPDSPRARRPAEQSYWGLETRPARTSPNGLLEAAIEDSNVVLTHADSGERIALTENGVPDNEYERQFFWSPDSSRLVAMRLRKPQPRRVYLIESSPTDQLQPKLQDFEYAKPGDPLEFNRPHLFNAVTRQEIPIADPLFSNPFDIRFVGWSEDSKHFWFLYNQRGHQVLRVIKVDAETGETGCVVDEQSPTFVDYAHKTFWKILPSTVELIWMSERSGWSHLYLIDARTGQVKRAITQGSWVVRGIEHVDVDRREIWFWAGGIYPEQDPYYVHLARVDFDGNHLTLLTDGNGTHQVFVSPDRQFLVDVYSRVDLPPVTELRRVADGGLVCTLEQADDSELKNAGWKTPERFVAKGRDGTTDIYGVIFRPSTFDPTRSYPVIEQVYAGPQASYAPKRFRSFHGPQAMAELGFVVVQVDGMGTSHRSKAFHDVCWKNLADAGFPDRKNWIRAVGAKYSYIDLTRVGIVGGSAGGQSALRGLLDHGDFYQAAVADCGCHDNRMDKVWWNELWMGWPVGSQYEENSNVKHADRLQGKLMLIVGELDRNVDPASTMQVVAALIKANKDFDLVVLPGVGHGGLGTAYGRRRSNDFFVRHLLHVEPRWTMPTAATQSPTDEPPTP